MAGQLRALFVLSGADRWTLREGEVHPSGVWAEEVAVPFRLMESAGWSVTVATPGGVEPTIDQASLGVTAATPWKLRNIRAQLERMRDVLARPMALVDAASRSDDFDLIFYPGGHGPMEDLAYDDVSGALLAHRLISGRALALICHGPAAVLAARRSDGSNVFAGREMTGLSNREELLNPFSRRARWLLEDELVAAGISYRKGLPLLPHVVVDGNLYTGQNPQSSQALADTLIRNLAGHV